MDIYIVDIVYLAGLDRIEPLIPGHRAFLDRIEAQGALVASGAKVPRDGGVMILRAASAEAVAEMVAADPLNAPGLTAYRVTRMAPARLHPGLAAGPEQAVSAQVGSGQMGPR